MATQDYIVPGMLLIVIGLLIANLMRTRPVTKVIRTEESSPLVVIDRPWAYSAWPYGYYGGWPYYGYGSGGYSGGIWTGGGRGGGGHHGGGGHGGGHH